MPVWTAEPGGAAESRAPSDTESLPTVGGLDLDASRRYAERLQARWVELQHQALKADRHLARAQLALDNLVGRGLDIELALALASVRAARELL